MMKVSNRGVFGIFDGREKWDDFIGRLDAYICITISVQALL